MCQLIQYAGQFIPAVTKEQYAAKIVMSKGIEFDSANTQNTIDILCSLAHEKGYCVIIVTHDMEVAEAADVTFRMRDGELREYKSC